MKKIMNLSMGALVAVILFASCATIVSKSSYPLNIRTEPVNAKVSITDKKGLEVYKGTCPTIVTLNAGAGFFAKAQYQVKLSAPGYDEKIIPVTYKLDGWYFGNIVFGGLIGMLIVDPATGAMWKPKDFSISESLIESGSTSNTPTLNIIDIKNVSKELKSQLVRIN